MLASPLRRPHSRSIICGVTVTAQIFHLTAGCLPRWPSHGDVTGSCMPMQLGWSG